MSEVSKIDKPLKVGLIGTGSSATNIASSISMIENLEIVTIADINMESAKKLADQHKVKDISNDYKYVCEKENLDYVIVSVPHGLHHEITMYALNKGKNVLCEKPIATTIKDAEEMINTAKKNNLKLGIFFQNRFFDAVQEGKRIMKDGELGTILQANASVMWFRDEDYYQKSGWRGTWKLEGGGSLINQAVHTIDELIYMMGDVDAMFGMWGHKVHEIEVDDNTCAALLFKSGAFGCFQTSTSSGANFPAKITIYGSEKAIEIDGNILTILNPDGTKVIKDYAAEEGGQVGSSNDPKKFSLKAQMRMLHNYSQAIIENKEPMVSGEEALRSLKVVLGVYESNGEKVVKF